MNMMQIETPAPILFEDEFIYNVDLMQKLCTEANIGLRPHYKSHKCPSIAHIQIQRGAKGMVCATLGEASDLADSGINDILIGNQIVQPFQVAQLAYLAKKCHLTVCVDDEENISALNDAAKLANSLIHCYVEIDVGMKRCGVCNYVDVKRLALAVLSASNLRFSGIQAYAGNLAHEHDYNERKAKSREVDKRLQELIDFLDQEGITVNDISGVSTGTTEFKLNDEIYTEIQAGSYIFMDNAYRPLNLPFKQSLFIISSVISISPGVAITDVGIKACGLDQGPPLIHNLPGDAVLAMSEEHTKIYSDSLDLKLNDKLLYTPGHCCTTMNLFSKIYTIKNDTVTNCYPIVSRR